MVSETWNLAQHWQFAAESCGIRGDTDRLDLALVVSDGPASAAGVFTQNRVFAAPVRVCRERLPAAGIRALVVCSGNANACTGQEGYEDALRMCRLTAEVTGCKPEQVLVCSTGVIGRRLPMHKIEAGVRSAGSTLQRSPNALAGAAQSILTTDTCIKVSTSRARVGNIEVVLTGFAKGAAMIGPNMATMLAFILTDASVAPADLQEIVIKAAERSFNAISVEGHTSTNDSLIVLANGSGPQLRGSVLTQFADAVTGVCRDLARAIAADAEGARHLITIEVEGLRTETDAQRIARTIANSALVKTAIYGADPNWGRIVSAAGYAGVDFVEKDLSLWLGDSLLYEAGTPLPFDAQRVSGYMRENREIHVRLRFTLGPAGFTFWTCDLTPEYVHMNADYTT
jgi:glutamate N-acetyltransferase/amino-acid N-acetyltransferase